MIVAKNYISYHISCNPYAEVIPHKSEFGNTFKSFCVDIIWFAL